ncbi:MAG TPA: Plug domain-containing protein [Longimicrobiaceae bacterium]|nr:Plug domain-containing protein [Longimicrobiaceae bacterium]
MTPSRAFLAALLSAVSLAACAVAPAATNPRASAGDLITAQEIQRSGARTAWQVLERQPGLLRMGAGAAGRTSASSHRASPEAPGAGEPLLIVDGARMENLDVLRDIPAESIQSIEVLDGVNAPTYPGAAHGVVIVRTAPQVLP